MKEVGKLKQFKKKSAPLNSCTIPSTGQKIHFRPMTVREERDLNLSFQNGVEEAIVCLKDVLSGCIKEKVKVEEFKTFDIEWLFMKLRASSNGEETRTQGKCEKCDGDTIGIIDVSKAELIGDCSDKKIDLGDYTIVLTYPVYEVQQKLIKIAERAEKKEVEEIDAALEASALMVKQVYNEEDAIDTKDVDISELVDFLLEQEESVLKEIMTYIEAMPVVTAKVDIHCTQCKEKSIKEVKGIENFF